MMLMVCEKPQGIRTCVTLVDDRSQGIRIAMLMGSERLQGIRTCVALVDDKSEGIRIVMLT